MAPGEGSLVGGGHSLGIDQSYSRQWEGGSLPLDGEAGSGGQPHPRGIQAPHSQGVKTHFPEGSGLLMIWEFWDRPQEVKPSW